MNCHSRDASGSHASLCGHHQAKHRNLNRVALHHRFQAGIRGGDAMVSLSGLRIATCLCLAGLVIVLPGPFQADTEVHAQSMSPSWLIFHPDIDDCVESHLPDQNWGSIYEAYVSGAEVGFTRYIYFRFNLTDVLQSGSIIHEAHFNLYKSYDTSGVNGYCRLMAANPASPSWVETSMTWNNQPGVDPACNQTSSVLGRIQEFYCTTSTGFRQNISSPALTDLTASQFARSGFACFFVSSNFTGQGSKGWQTDEGANRPYIAILYTPGPVGLLRVTTNPAVPSMICIDGNWASRWGLDWVKLPVGQHILSFGEVQGFGTPDPVTLTVSEGQITTYEAQFERYGDLRVMTSPAVPSTIYVNGIPRNDWGLWVDVPAGVYTVSFGYVPGAIMPPSREVVVMSGSSTLTVGIFTSI